MTYKSYKAFAGTYNRDDSVPNVLKGINERDETIISVTGVGIDQVYVLIITRTPDQSRAHFGGKEVLPC